MFRDAGKEEALARGPRPRTWRASFDRRERRLARAGRREETARERRHKRESSTSVVACFVSLCLCSSSSPSACVTLSLCPFALCHQHLAWSIDAHTTPPRSNCLFWLLDGLGGFPWWVPIARRSPSSLQQQARLVFLPAASRPVPKEALGPMRPHGATSTRSERHSIEPSPPHLEGVRGAGLDGSGAFSTRPLIVERATNKLLLPLPPNAPHTPEATKVRPAAAWHI